MSTSMMWCWSNPRSHRVGVLGQPCIFKTSPHENSPYLAVAAVPEGAGLLSMGIWSGQKWAHKIVV